MWFCFTPVLFTDRRLEGPQKFSASRLYNPSLGRYLKNPQLRNIKHDYQTTCHGILWCIILQITFVAFWNKRLLNPIPYACTVFQRTELFKKHGEVSCGSALSNGAVRHEV
jgi:hypothetical protein